MTVPDHPRLGEKIDMLIRTGVTWIEVTVISLELQDDGKVRLVAKTPDMRWVLDQAVVNRNWKRIQ